MEPARQPADCNGIREAVAGFRVVGIRERIGQHHGRWRDVVLIERRSPVAWPRRGGRIPRPAGRARSAGRGQPRCEALDAAGELGERGVEAGGIPGRDRVRDGPVHGGLAA